MNRAEMLAVLTKAGITVAADATDAQVSQILAKHLGGDAPAAAAVSPELAALIAKSAAESVAPVLEQLKKKATNNMGTEELPTEEDPRPVAVKVGKHMTEGTGLNFVRMAKAIGTVELERKNGRQVTLEGVIKGWAKKDRNYDVLVKTFTQSLMTDGGTFVPENFAAEIIELLRHIAVIRTLGYRSTPLPNGNITIGRQSGAATAAYIDEGAVISVSKPATDAVKLVEKKLAALVPVSNDLIRNASIAAEEFVRADLLKVMALREDLAFIRGDGSASTPRGLRYDTAAANVVDETTGSKTPTLAEVRTELNGMVYGFESNDVPMLNPRMIINPRTKLYLKSLADGNGNDPIFLREMDQGKIMGIPFAVTNQIPSNLGSGTNESEMYIYEADEFMIGDGLKMELTVSPDGTYEDGGSAKSGLSRDETPIRILSTHDCKLRHNVACVIRTNVIWGS